VNHPDPGFPLPDDLAEAVAAAALGVLHRAYGWPKAIGVMHRQLIRSAARDAPLAVAEQVLRLCNVTPAEDAAQGRLFPDCDGPPNPDDVTR
jgi:hypothetical protein